MDSLDLFRLALGPQQPWTVTRTDFDAAEGRLDLYLDFPRGARFPCPVQGCGQGECSVYDTEDKTWRHMDFFQHKAYLHARVPRVRCAGHGVHQVGLSWARPESGFTLLFEALPITFAAAMPVAKVAEMTSEPDTRIWRVIEHHVDTGRAKLSFADVTKVGLDETAAARGQDYVTVFMDMVARGGAVRHRGSRCRHGRTVRPGSARARRRPGSGHRHQLRHERRVHLRHQRVSAPRAGDV